MTGSSTSSWSVQLVLLLLPQALALPSHPSIWSIRIDNDPAPAPEDGPPLSASAIRDKAYLAGEVGAILGAYIFVVLVVTLALYTIGRRLRRSAQTSPRSLAMEIINPLKAEVYKMVGKTDVSLAKSNPWGPSPISPTTTKNEWPSPMRGSQTWKSEKSHNRQLSTQGSVITFDESVIEEDRARNEIEMDRLYAAVAEHDEEKTRSVTHPHAQPLSQHPPELQHLRVTTRPIPPPIPQDGPISPARTLTASPRRNGSRLSKPSPISTADSYTHSRASSRTSNGSFGKKRSISIRNLPISPPMGSPDFAPDNLHMYGEAEPLSPRLYTPRAPPTPPINRHDSITSSRPSEISSPRRFHFLHSARSSRSVASPTSPRFRRSITSPTSPQFTSRASAAAPLQFTSEEPDNINQPPTPGLVVTPVPTIQTPARGKNSRKPAPLFLRSNTASSAGSASSSTTQLPLRSAPLPLRSTHNSQRPVSTIKATVLDRPVQQSGRLGVPGTAGLVPATPYSPYMPFTPLTPMTPSRLVTREERKRREREEGRRVVTVEDRVVEEGEMWGDGWS